MKKYSKLVHLFLLLTFFLGHINTAAQGYLKEKVEVKSASNKQLNYRAEKIGRSDNADVSLNDLKQKKYTYVLVHGAFHGGWCWSKVANILRSKGYRVFTPTFTGLGERSHLLNNEVDLNTFITDIKSVIENEELQNVILVGHSFGGTVISGVIDQMQDRIAGAVYLDATMGASGKSVFDGAPADVKKARMDAAVSLSNTKAILPPASGAFGLTDREQVAWVDRRMTPMPFKSYETPLVLKNKVGGDIPKQFIHAINPVLPNIVPSAKYAKDKGWYYSEIKTGHDAMVSMPKEVAKQLLSFVDKISRK